MYEAVIARPAGESTVARLAKTAAEYGYDGIVVRNPGDQPADYDREAIIDTYDVDVVDGVEIVAEDPSRASGFLGNHRPERTIVAVRGGSAAMNRFAVEHPAVDVLARPFGADGTAEAGDVGVDHVLAKTAAENGVRLEFDLGPVVGDGGGGRVRALRSLRRLRTLVDQYDVSHVVSVRPESHLDLRTPRDLSALGDVAGLAPGQIAAGLEEWGSIAERNRARQSDAFVEPGVWLCNEE